jgi:hypothetical protein
MGMGYGAQIHGRRHAKITMPSMPNCYPRGRVFARLNHLISCGLIWISAPAGYGKTTALDSRVELKVSAAFMLALSQAIPKHKKLMSSVEQVSTLVRANSGSRARRMRAPLRSGRGALGGRPPGEMEAHGHCR